jgi:predicted house-cleaning NTP pyrophosphatase (Maf/HAM1 superfamily)
MVHPPKIPSAPAGPPPFTIPEETAKKIALSLAPVPEEDRDCTSVETETRFAIGWKGNYRIEGAAFIFTDRNSGRVVTILGYPTQRLVQLSSEISNMFG